MQTLHQTRVEAFAGQIATEIGAALNAVLVTVGDEERHRTDPGVRLPGPRRKRLGRRVLDRQVRRYQRVDG